MKRRDVLTASALATTAITAAPTVASAAPGAAASPSAPAAPPGHEHAPGLATKDTLAFAAGSTLLLGTAVAGGGHHDDMPYPPPFTDDETYRELLGSEFTSLSAENQMKWEFIHPEPDTYDFAAPDAIMEFAAEHGQQVRGHTLLWHSQNPEWLEQGGYGPEELRALLRDHIETVMTRYKGRIYQWDVANEIFDDSGQLRTEENIWLRELGPEIIGEAFTWARAADPEALLFLNDYSVDSIGPKSDAYYALISDLLDQGVPVDGFSTQSHLSLAYDFPHDLAENLQRFADLGLATAITELDVRMALADGAEPTQEQLEQQADYYRWAVEAALAVDGCDSLTIWGFVDTYSWVPNTFPGEGAATVMWEDYTRKPAYDALQDALAQGSGRAGHPALRG